MKFNLKDFLIFLLLLFIEVLIANTSGFIRHTFGDFLVVILLFYLVKTFINLSNRSIGFSVLIFAFVVEFLQLSPLLEYLGLQNNRFAVIVFGATFSFGDLLAYTLGITTALFIEKYLKQKLPSYLS